MYCDFYSITDSEDAIPQFVEAMCWEITNCTIDVSDWEFDTIFIGGGTPSLLKAIHIDGILSCLNKNYDLSNVKEITIEANPGEAPKDRLKDLKSMGINRLSIGVQSLQPQLLKFLTRIHSKEQVFETYNNARLSGFNNINCDLIYSIPNQTLNMWEQDLNTIIKMEPEHISAYALTVEKGTDLFSMVYNNKISMPSDRQGGKWFIKTHDILSDNGYQAYEISNFSKAGFECRHNLHYWDIDPYLAFGPSAHGFDGIHRWNNARSLDQYLERIRTEKSPISKIERIELFDHLNELIGFGLRMRKGVDINMIPIDHQKEFQKKIILLSKKYPDCLQSASDIISLTQRGMLYSDRIIPELIF
tara:strand:+ start:675 stop:1754 length:1080 start_codon:yes stop_codon:yes gene_type:complete